jgi:hypothetical protein
MMGYSTEDLACARIGSSGSSELLLKATEEASHALVKIKQTLANERIVNFPKTQPGLVNQF